MPERNPGFATIEFVGELTIKSVAESRERLLQAFGESSNIRANIASDTIVDLTFIQLIESARRTAREAGGEFRLAGPAAGPLRETLERGGFLTQPRQRDFWLLQSEGR